jgi:hypothetical protein
VLNPRKPVAQWQVKINVDLDYIVLIGELSNEERLRTLRSCVSLLLPAIAVFDSSSNGQDITISTGKNKCETDAESEKRNTAAREASTFTNTAAIPAESRKVIGIL